MNNISEIAANVLKDIKNTDRPLSPIYTGYMGKPNCICGGSGLYRKDVAVNDPDFGKLFICSCVDKSLIANPKYGIFGTEFYLTWDDLYSTSNTMDVVAKIDQALQLRRGFIYLWGGYGNAKSQVLKTVVALAIDQSLEAAFTELDPLFEYIRQGYRIDNPSDSAAARLEWYQDLDVLCVDEFDKLGGGTEWENRKLFTLLNHRFARSIRGENCLTIIASNNSPTTLPGYLLSRLTDGRSLILCMLADDQRPYMMGE